MDHILLIHPSVRGHLVHCFRLLGIVNNAAMSMSVEYPSEFLLLILLLFFY